MIDSPEETYYNLNMNQRVYIVQKRDFETGTNSFQQVFFTQEAAKEWINTEIYPGDFFIEEFEQQPDGTAAEVV